MESMMEQLLSKEFLYEPLSDMAAKVNRFPFTLYPPPSTHYPLLFALSGMAAKVNTLPPTLCGILQDLENQFMLTLARVAVRTH
jgi:hypothetical protein